MTLYYTILLYCNPKQCVQFPITGTHNYGCIHYSSAMSPDGIGYVTNVDGVEVFVVARLFHKDLVVEIVEVLGNKDMDIPHYFQNIQALRKHL